MTVVRPFRALRYDPERVDLGRVLVPPYDVIAPGDRERLYASDPHSAVRLELTRSVESEATTDYSEVADVLTAWRDAKLLVRDPRPAFYALRSSFTAPDGAELERTGFFALLRLEDYSRRIVRPHERTLAGPKADRLKMLRATRANLSSVFLLYEDRDDRLPDLLSAALGGDRAVEARDETGVTHRLAAVDGPASIDALARLLADRPVVIADGHHRYETALAYRDEVRARSGESAPDAPSEYILAFFANAWAPGSLLLPIHRLVLRGAVPDAAAWAARLPGWVREDVEASGAEAIPGVLEKHLAPLRDRHAFAADDGSGRLRIFSRERASDELSVRAIHREVVEGAFGLDEEAVRDGAIAYPKSALQTARDLRGGHGRVALYLNPMTAEEVFRVTGAGEVLPQKSTFFYPKLPTGLVFRTLEDEQP